MLQAVLKAKEQQLARKAQQRLHWWSTRRLRSLILVVPSLTKDIPLWSYNDESLACARLCGLTVIELQSKLRVYWEKPAWQRWLLYWFTSIRQQLAVWTYYQQCMTFRSWKASLRVTEAGNHCSARAREIINSYTARTIKKMFKTERYLDQHARRWRKNLPLFQEKMASHERRLSSEFFWDRKALDTIPICEMYSTFNIVQTVYKKTINVLYQYFFDYYRNTYVKILFSSPPQYMQLVLASSSSPTVLAKPPSGANKSPSHTNQPVESTGISSFNFSSWVNTRQNQIKTVLQQQEPTAVTQAMYLLQESFSSLTDIIEPLITPIQDLIYQMHWFTYIPTQEALQFISLLENQLLKLYRAAIPLFHPDKYHTSAAEENQTLKTLCHELTCHYQSFIEKCQKTLEDRKKDIFKIEIQREANEKRFQNKPLSWAGMWQQLKNIEKGIKAFDEKMEKTDAKLKNHEARIQALFRKRRSEKFNQSHRLFKLKTRRLSMLKEELEEEKASIIFNL